MYPPRIRCRLAIAWVCCTAGTNGAEPLVRTLPVGVTVAEQTVVLGNQAVLEGESPAATALRAAANLTGAIVESRGFHTLPAGAKWSSDAGLPQLVTIRDLIIDGDRNIADDWRVQAERKVPDTLDGLRLFASGKTLERVKIANCPGWGAVLRRGNNSRQGEWQLTDWEEDEIGSLGIMNCHGGLKIESGSDGTISRLVVGNVRGAALEFGGPTGGWFTNFAHLYGADIGCHTRGGGQRFNQLQTETVRVGWINEANATLCSQWIAFATSELAGDFRAPTCVVIAQVQSSGDGVAVGPNAGGTEILGGFVNLTDATGQKMEADGTVLTVAAPNCRIDVNAWGGERLLVIPEPIVGSSIVIRASGRTDDRPYVIEMPKGLGPGNRIRVQVRGEVELRAPDAWTRRQVEIVKQ